MTQTLGVLYGTSNQAITVTLGGLTTTSQRASANIQNSATPGQLDALVQLKIKTGASNTSATGYLVVYAYGSVDGGATFSDGVAGTDAGVTLTSPPNLRRIGTINAVANATTYTSPLMSVAAAFGGVLPQYWGIVVENQTGGTLDATEGNHTKAYQYVSGSGV